MKILRFPVRARPAPRLLEGLVSIENLLAECAARQASLREDRRTLMRSLRRLADLSRSVVRSAEDLRRSAGRLRSCRGRMAARSPRV